MTEDDAVDATIAEPSTTAGEAESLLRRGAVEGSRTAWSSALADRGLDQPAKLTTGSGASPNVRR
jgi:hypothetical protein